jgi:tetratricopeptide (TPR) repeat protein
MLNEAIHAARLGDKTRARDLLTRLLRIDQDHPDHWLWMSAVVDTRQEQIYCLQNLQRIDPKNVVAARGLVLLGAVDADPAAVRPVAPRRRDAWTVAELEIERPRGMRAIMANPFLRFGFYGLATVFVIGMLWLGVNGIRSLPGEPTPDIDATNAAIGPFATLTATITPEPTSTPLFRTPTPTPGMPTPLALLLDATYTPTPLYVNTPHTATEAYRLGLNAHERGDWETVIMFMQQTIDADPDAADAYYYMGEAQMQLGDYPAALASFEAALDLDDTFGAAYFGRAQARLALDHEADVDEDFGSALSYASDFGAVYLARAAHLISRGDLEGAEADLVAAETFLPESPLIPYWRAVIAVQREQYAAALPLAEQAHAGDFTHLPTYRLLGQIHLALGNGADAAEWLTTYTRYQTEDVDALILLGQSLTQAGEHDRALAIYARLLELDPQNAALFHARALAYLETGEPQLALEDLNEANRLDRNNFDILIALTRALIEVGEPGNAFVQANETEPFARSDRQRALLFYYRGLALKAIVENGDESSRPAAIRDLKAALALAPYLPADLADLALQSLLELDPGAEIPPTVTPTPQAAP